jgi:hypothetical protein
LVFGGKKSKTTAKTKVSLSAARKIPGNVTNHESREFNLSETGQKNSCPYKGQVLHP